MSEALELVFRFKADNIQELESIPGQVTPNYTGSPVTVMASFIDPAGLAAHANNIADAVNTAMKGGHQINATISQIGS